MILGFLQHFVDPDRAGRNRALGVFHAGAQRILQAEIDGVETEFFRHLVDHHFSRRHALQRAVAARGTGVDRAGGDGHRGQVVFGEIINRLRGGGAHHRYRRREIGAAAAVGFELALERLQQAALAVDRDAIVHLEGVALDRSLELFIAVVGQAHRLAVRI